MPKIPTYDSPQVMPGAAPTPQFQAPQVDQLLTGQRQIGGLAQANSQFTQQVGAIAADMQQRATVQKLTDSEAKLTEALSAFNTEARQRLGENAKGLTKDAQDYWDKTVKSISDGLEDDVQRNAFARIAARRHPTFTSGIAGHEFEQGKTAANAAGEASINQSIGAAAAAANGGMTPQAQADIAANKDSMLRTLKATLEANGLQGTLPEKQMAMTTKLHAEVIQALLPKDPDQAKAWYYGNKKEIDGKAQVEIEKMLDTTGSLVKAQKVAGELYAQGMDYAAASEYAAKNYEGKQLELIRHELKTREQERKLGEELRDQKMLESAQTILAEATAKGRWIPQSVIDSETVRLKSRPELQLQVLAKIAAHNEHVQNLADAAKARARANAERMQPSDAQVTNWYGLKTDAETLRTVNLQTMYNAGQLNLKQFNDLVGDQQQLRKGGITEDNILGDKAAVDLVLKGAKIETTGKSADPALLAKFYERYNSAVKAEGKDVTQARKIEIARGLLNQVAVERDYWYGTTEKPAFNVAPTDRVRADKTAVPSVDREKIIGALRRQGLPVTEESIKALYIKGLGQ